MGGGTGVGTLELQRFYRHSDKTRDIGWKTMGDIYTIGPVLAKVLGLLEEHGLSQRSFLHAQDGGWSGDLYVVHRRLFNFQNEVAAFMGDSGRGGSQLANVYEVVINSTGGWAQYLSLVLKDCPPILTRPLSELNFAPAHSYLAQNDPVSNTSGDPGRLWLDYFVELSRPSFRIPVVPSPPQ